MKYLKTKYGIMTIDFEIDTELPTTIGIHTAECDVGEYQGIEVLKQSESIKELCDEFVGIRKSNHKPYIGRPNGFSWFQETNGWVGRLDNYESIYGAIWTFDNEGTPTLKSVAKMNMKGDFELL